MRLMQNWMKWILPDTVMENVQTVYAGLTYGRNNLNENLADQGINRGFRV